MRTVIERGPHGEERFLPTRYPAVTRRAPPLIGPLVRAEFGHSKGNEVYRPLGPDDFSDLEAFEVAFDDAPLLNIT